MTKSSSAQSPTGPKATGKGTKQSPKTHLLVPAINLGPDEDEEEDEYRPAATFGTRRVVHQSEQALSASGSAHGDERDHEAQRQAAEPAVIPSAPHAPASHQPEGAAQAREPFTDTAPPASVHGAVAPTSSLAEHGAATNLSSTSSKDSSDQQVPWLDRDAVERTGTGGVPREEPVPSVPAEPRDLPAVRSAGSLSGVPARRPGRRRAGDFTYSSKQPRQRNEQAMHQLAQLAPSYANLLTVYSAGQLNLVQFEPRNVNLYGLTADQAGTQVAADKALLKTLTMQRPRLTVANYVDAALEPILRPLNPDGIDLDEMEVEREYVEELAQKGRAYRAHIVSDPDSARMPHHRPVCPLRVTVNARLTRMMDLMDSMQGLQVKPFEIVSACLAEFLASLPDEQPHLMSFFEQHTVTTVQ